MCDQWTAKPRLETGNIYHNPKRTPNSLTQTATTLTKPTHDNTPTNLLNTPSPLSCPLSAIVVDLSKQRLAFLCTVLHASNPHQIPHVATSHEPCLTKPTHDHTPTNLLNTPSPLSCPLSAIVVDLSKQPLAFLCTVLHASNPHQIPHVATSHEPCLTKPTH